MLNFINKYIFGTSVPLMLVVAGIYYIFLLRGFHIFKIKKVVKVFFKRECYNDNNSSSSFRALTLALAGTLGVGNIVGVSAAIYLGGPGAIFWMWISAFCAMLLKYAEVVIAMKHRKYDKEGKPHGCAMYYINDFFNSIGLHKLGRFIAMVFGIFFIINAITMGSMIQANAISNSFFEVMNVPKCFIGIVFGGLVLLILLKNIDAISRITEKLVPIMSIGFILLSFAVISIKHNMVMSVIKLIFEDAFSLNSAVGGIGGIILSSSIRYGTMRGLVSNEAGCGTAPTAHTQSGTLSAVEQGFWGIFEVFIDTIVLCTMTAIVVLISFSDVSHYGNNFIMMTISSYSYVLGDVALLFMLISILCFAFATILCWAHYGITSVKYLFPNNTFTKCFVYIYAISVFAGCIINSDIIWDLADFAIGVMTVINVIIICFFSKEVKKETDRYFNNL